MGTGDPASFVPAAALRRFAVDVLASCGVPSHDAETVADVLLDADLRGVSSHGVALLEGYVRRVQGGKARTRPAISVVREKGGIALLDGGFGLGPVVASRAMDNAIEKARVHGIGAVGVRNANHFAAAGYYAARAAAGGMIGLATSNAAAIMAPPGGTTAVVGNNPIAIAVPGNVEGHLLADMTLSVVSYNKIRQAARRGESIPRGWALDERGEPTEDASVALKGLLEPIGAHKGFALALMLDVLTGALTGGLFPWEVLERGHSGMGYFFIAMDVDAFVPLDEFQGRVDELIRKVRSSAHRTGVERVFAPGERSAMAKKGRLRTGIPISSLPWPDLERLADEFKVVLVSPNASRQ